MRGAHDLGESGKQTTASYSWLGKKESAASDTCGFATVMTAEVPRVKDEKRADRNGGCAVGGEVQPLYTHF